MCYDADGPSDWWLIPIVIFVVFFFLAGAKWVSVYWQFLNS